MAVEVEIDVEVLKSEIKKTYASVSEQPEKALRCAFELLRRILRPPERLPRPPRVGVGPKVHVRVAQQREDRMIERRGADLDLPALREVAIDRQHFGHESTGTYSRSIDLRYRQSNAAGI